MYFEEETDIILNRKESGMPKTQTEQIFSRQYKRMENELKDVNVPSAVITILSKFWKYCENDIKNKVENGDRNGPRIYKTP